MAFGMALVSCLALSLWAVAAPVAAQQGASLFGKRTASVTYGPYGRIEIGRSLPSPRDGSWLPPGASDPRIGFELDGNDTTTGAVALGYDWMNGFRADFTFLMTGSSDVSGGCSDVANGTPCSDHVDGVEAPLKTKAVMASLFFSPMEWRGSSSIFQPFVVAGAGVAWNEIDDWSRDNARANRPVRRFEGDTTSGFAWSVGVGASLQLTRPGKWPVLLEASWRYYDFGEAKGGAMPLPDNGMSTPRKPLTFDNRSQVISIGLRIPLRRL
jgi:opacity protein-like surface antigen